MASWKHQVKNRFSEQATQWAACYADPEPTLSSQHLISRQRFALKMVEAAMPPSSRILEVGCGAGVMAAKLIKRGYAVWGIDLAEPMIRHARQLCESDPFGVGDIEHIPFPDNTFDVVVSLGVIEYLESDEQALREVWRVLRPGGRAVIAIPNGRSPLRRLDGVVPRVVAVLRPAYHLVKYRFRARPAPSSERFAGTVHHAPYRRFYRRRWLRLLRGLNFEPEEWICHGWGWLSSPLGFLVQSLSMKQAVFRRGIERLVGRALLSRASDTFVRSSALNWLAAEHIFRVRAIK
ncbi:MAG: hypothetical protein DMD61_09150 [Gemmatimonadetes bacterium]|nr:MAG: hypothetical protein DMD61_09150 [Gemmatimonadota bacterium]